jgi:hypothetical protein
VLVLIVGPIGNDRTDAPLAGGFAVGFGVISLVGQRRPGFDVRADVEQDLELRAVAGLAAGEMEIERVAFEVGLEVDFRRESATREAERMAVLPPFAPAAETWARTTVLSNIWTRCAVLLASASAWKNASNAPLWLKRENRLQTLFQLPNSAGNARQETLLTVKKCIASRNLRSSRPLSPRRERHDRKSSIAKSHSSSVIFVSIVGSRKPNRLAMNHRSATSGRPPNHFVAIRPHDLIFRVFML